MSVDVTIRRLRSDDATSFKAIRLDVSRFSASQQLSCGSHQEYSLTAGKTKDDRQRH